MQIYSNCDIIIQTCLATETITSIIHKAYYEVINSLLLLIPGVLRKTTMTTRDDDYSRTLV